MPFRITQLFSVVVLAGAAGAAVAKPIQVAHWPFDVPCDAIQKNGDVWQQTKDMVVGNALMRGNTFRHTGETAVWDRKCLGTPMTP